MSVGKAFLFVWCVGAATGNISEQFYQDNRVLAKTILEAMQDSNFNEEVIFDLRKENQVYLNRTMSLVIKYVVKREVDIYRSRRTDPLFRKIYSALIMKLIDIAKDLDKSQSSSARIDTAHRYYMTVQNQEMHDEMADVQVFHACARLYDILFSAPRIFATLGPPDDLTPRILMKKLNTMQVKPVHLAVTLLIQFHLRSTVNFVIRTNALNTLTTKPQSVGPQVVETIKNLAARLLPVAELIDIHLANSSPAFKDTCPATWLGIVNNK